MSSRKLTRRKTVCNIDDFVNSEMQELKNNFFTNVINIKEKAPFEMTRDEIKELTSKANVKLELKNKLL